MRKGLLIIALGLFVSAGPATADVLAVPEQDPAGAPAIKLPAKGSTMPEVEKRFGQPRARLPTVAGNTPEHPPITRWDYDGFLVIFEHDRVVDAVIPGAPPRVYHKDRLRPAAASAAPPAPPVPMEAAPSAEPAVTDAPELPVEAEAEPDVETAEETADMAADGEPAPLAPDTADVEMSEDDAPAEASPDNPYPDRPTPAEAPAEEAPEEDSPPTPR